MFETISGIPQWRELIDSLKEGHLEQAQSLGILRSARFAALSALRKALPHPILYILDKPSHANLALDELKFWLPQAEILSFPAPDPLFYEPGAWDPFIRAERIKTLTRLAEIQLPGKVKTTGPMLIVTSVRALMTKTVDRRSYLKGIRILRVNQEHNLDRLIHDLVQIGYEAVSVVLEPGKFSKRGGLLDIWLPSCTEPYRIDFFGDEIESIHSFDPQSQRNLKPFDSVRIAPASEVFTFSGKLPETSGENPSEFLLPLLNDNPETLLDYLPANSLIVSDDLLQIRLMAEDIEEQAEKLKAQSVADGILPADFPAPYFSLSEILDQAEPFARLDFGRGTEAGESAMSDFFVPSPRFSGKLSSFIEFVMDRFLSGRHVTVVSRQMQRLQLMWNDLEPPANTGNAPEFVHGTLHEGFQLEAPNGAFVLLTDNEIFGWERPLPRKSQLKAAENPENSYADLKPNDFVVHIDYGIGKYVGVVNRTVDGLTKDYLCLEYARGDQLFVPVHQADRVTNYVGPDGRKPDLTRLGTQEWLGVKQHVREKVVEVAQELLDLYAVRQVAPGFAFSKDTIWQQEMEGAFPYVETEDQKLAISQVKADMERARPMDRLICGDVGFGKTEVALRAAFKAFCDNKQVAILVPTTVLAQQHYETFSQRFASFPLNVEMLSRFRTAKEQAEILEKLEQGKIDIIIGTHRLISKDVRFKDLGLLIIDEEQRFGVSHKEYLKKKRAEVDVLTMTATPIPRTLYMALTGVRDISSINTPPDERVPVVTHVGPYSDKLVRQAILRELGRDGQVFFVHNRVQSIYAMAQHLEKLVPEARIGIGHGQLPEKELSKVMDAFYDHHIDVLLSTSIIESGLDVPNANTLIADRADMLGLAQLYQIRGRVGRSSQRAYAYFFQQANHRPTEEGLERLEVIAENTQLGAGYSIALRDLEMRGAGEILGNRQHGSIASVGFHLYTRMLAQAVKVVREIRGIEADKGAEKTEMVQAMLNPVSVELPIDVSIPESYVSDQKMRIKLYRRVASVHDEFELTVLEEEFKERFGPIPEPVGNLFFQIRVKILAEAAGLSAVIREGSNVLLKFPPLPMGVEKRALPAVGSGIQAGKNAYRLMNINFNAEDWKETLLGGMDRVRHRMNQEKTDSADN